MILKTGRIQDSKRTGSTYAKTNKIRQTVAETGSSGEGNCDFESFEAVDMAVIQVILQ